MGGGATRMWHPGVGLWALRRPASLATPRWTGVNPRTAGLGRINLLGALETSTRAQPSQPRNSITWHRGWWEGPRLT